MLSTLNLRRAMLAALASLLFVTQAAGQESSAGDPVALVKRFVDPAPIADLTPYIGKEAEPVNRLRSAIMAAALKANSAELVRSDGQWAVVAVETVQQSQGNVVDLYFHLFAQPAWRIMAIRATPTPPWGQAAMSKLLGGRPRSGSDRDLKAFFEASRARLDELRDRAKPFLRGAVQAMDLAERKPEALRRLAGASAADIDRMVALLREIGAGAVSSEPIDMPYAAEDIAHAQPNPNFFDLHLWGIVDNYVGFFWASDPKQLPSMSPSNYIVIRDLGGGWYLYRTT
jgi:hypothetical protein